MKILVIEKNQESRVIMEQCLIPLGHELHHADNEQEGLRIIGAHAIDFIFIEMGSDAEAAVETIKSLRTPEKHAWFPVVALSANTDDDVHASAILAGADAILSKPLSRNLMIMQVISLERIYIARQNLQANKDLIAANLALLKLSMYDEVTDLPNRRYFEETLKKEFKLAKRHKSQLTVLMCEIDGFMRIIDRHGVDNGFHFIQALVSAINSIPARPTDLVCRCGSDLFSVILPGTDEKGANHVSEKINRSVNSELMKPSLALSAPPIVFNIGSATDDGRFRTLNELITAAVQSLQAAKKTSYILRNL